MVMDLEMVDGGGGGGGGKGVPELNSNAPMSTAEPELTLGVGVKVVNSDESRIGGRLTCCASGFGIG